MNQRPLAPPTVLAPLYDAVADQFGVPFADSYLWGATLTNGRLLPHTVTAWMVLNRDAAKLLKALDVTLEKPKPWPLNGHQRFEEVHPQLCDTDDFRAFKKKIAKMTGAYA